MYRPFQAEGSHDIEAATLERVGSLQENRLGLSLTARRCGELVWLLLGCRTGRGGIVTGDVSTVGVVVCESLIGRFPGSEGFRSFSKLPRRNPFRRCNPWRKSRPKGEMAEFRNSRRFD